MWTDIYLLFQILDQNLESKDLRIINNFGKTYVSYIIDDVQQSDSGIYTCQSEYTVDVNLTLHIDEGEWWYFKGPIIYLILKADLRLVINGGFAFK